MFEEEKGLFVLSDIFIPLIHDMKLRKILTTNVCHWNWTNAICPTK